MYSIETDEQNENAKRKTEWTKRNKWLYMLAEYEKRKKKKRKESEREKAHRNFPFNLPIAYFLPFIIHCSFYSCDSFIFFVELHSCACVLCSTFLARYIFLRFTHFLIHLLQAFHSFYTKLKYFVTTVLAK